MLFINFSLVSSVASHTDGSCMYPKSSEGNCINNTDKNLPKDMQNLDYVNEDGYTNHRGNYK